MPLSDIFGQQFIKLELESKTKAEVFEELIETIAVQHPDYDRAEMLKAVISREQQMNTAILAGIAVPHGYCKAVSSIVGAMGFSRSGIEYGSPEPVHAVVMLLMDTASREQHLLVLSRLLELLHSQAFAVIQAAASLQEVKRILDRF
ncbi:MAG: PTS sugar transporter subunit IIA [Treponema sp.]|jgi:mannitol/fructose-specific phosphotransferase system IIA component (Ntr-type)|nr:PTS sugar transporter subunit IIA [Treponema sp.]